MADEEDEEVSTVTYSHHWKTRQALIDDLIAINDEDNDDDDDDDDDDAYPQLHSAFFTKTEDLRQLEEQCGNWKKGRWSKQECDLLKSNLRSFMKESNITDLHVLFDDTAKHIEFYQKIARNIKRPLFIVYRKLLRLFTEDNYVGHWTRELNDKLLELHRIHGNDWITIGRSMGIGSSSCSDHFRSIKKNHRSGAWSSEEVSKLCEVMVREYGIEDCELPRDVTWEMISNVVETRNSLQCRMKWVMILSWKLKGGEAKWTAADDLRLIESLNEDEELEDEEDVDWERLSIDWPSVRSKYYLRQKWMNLKRTVPFRRSKIFRECVLYLMRHRVPAIRKQLEYSTR